MLEFGDVCDSVSTDWLSRRNVEDSHDGKWLSGTGIPPVPLAALGPGLSGPLGITAAPW